MVLSAEVKIRYALSCCLVDTLGVRYTYETFGVTMLKIECPSWHGTAPCRGRDDIFFSSHPSDRKVAKNICLSKCSAVQSCRSFALDNDISIGVWGGLTGPELARLKA